MQHIMHTCERIASHLWPSARLSGGTVLPSPAGLVSKGCVREGCPARTGARLGDAAIAATHSSSAGALTEDACKAPHPISSNVILQAQTSSCTLKRSEALRQTHSNIKCAFRTACRLTATSSMQPRLLASSLWCTVRHASRQQDYILPQVCGCSLLR